MPLSNSVLHRYTPPTCTLQVMAYSSPVSRWVGPKVVKELQFDLRFDDPRADADKQFSITGNSNQLEALHAVVTDYIQELLNLSPESFAALGQETPFAPSVDNDLTQKETPSAPSVDDDVESDVWQMPTKIPPAPPESDRPNETMVQREPSASKSEYMRQTASGITAITQSEFLALRPATGLSHNLFLGSLATAETGQFIQLSVLQLFDLATALDGYASDVIALPTYANNTRTSSAPQAWANIAAVLFLGVGVTAIGLQVFNRPNSVQTASNRPVTTNSPQVVAPSPLPTVTATTILVPSPNSSIPPNGATSAIAVPSKAPVGQTVTPGSNSNLVPNGVPPQPIVVNPTAGQTTTTVTIPGQTSSSRLTPPIAVIPSPKLQASPNPNSAKPTAAAPQDRNSRESDAPTPQPSIAATRTAFVPNPQVVEVSNYFNQRWEPPTNLRSSLEYSIILDVDGSIQVIEPYGIASRTYLDRTGMPLIGERFVSANQNGQSPRIRLRFNPNGKVQAFLEAGDAR